MLMLYSSERLLINSYLLESRALGAFVLIVAIVAVCCVSHFVGFSNAWIVQNTTIHAGNQQFAKKLDKKSCGVYTINII